jgi:uncharacterized phage-associated protein
MVGVYDVVRFILQNYKRQDMTAMKLQKLLYYCQAWSLVWDDKPLFRSAMEAWASGPVVRKVYALYRGKYRIGSIPYGNVKNLSSSQKDTILSVLDYYGNKSSQWLSDLTHMEKPWREAREGLSEGERGDKVISHASMAEYYTSISP